MVNQPNQPQKKNARPQNFSQKSGKPYQQNNHQKKNVQPNPNATNPNKNRNLPPKDPKDARHFEVTPAFKAYFTNYCKEKAETARKRIAGIHAEMAPFLPQFLEQYPLFFSLSEDAALALFGEPQPKDGAENLVAISFKLTSRLQAYSSAAVEYYGYMGLIRDIDGVNNTERLFIEYNQVNPEQTFNEKVLGSKRRFFAKACNYAEQKVLFESKTAKEDAERTNE